MLEFMTLVLGPVATNTYLVADADSGAAAVIDPAWDGQRILDEAGRRGWEIGQIWYTHAHFDHFGGAAEIAAGSRRDLEVAMHPQDSPLWQSGGGAAMFGIQVDIGPQPGIDLAEMRILRLGGLVFEVRHTPGHSPGHCVYYCASAGVLFSGDLIFQGGVGRTDLPGGDWQALEKSIRAEVYTLPGETRILPGHGDATTVGEERMGNPYFHDDLPVHL